MYGGKTPASKLAEAAESNDAECVRALLEGGAKLDIKDKEGKTALDYAKTAEIRKLLQRGE